MNCPGCRLAEKDPTTVIAYAHCLGCDARALANSEMFKESAAAGAMSKPYRKALGQVFGERWKDGHAMVKQWAEKMKETR